MMVGTPVVFAIESAITVAYERLGMRALGFFVVYIRSRVFGVREPDATLMACSFDAVERRVSDRGKHIAPFMEANGGEIADAFRSAIYGDDDQDDKTYLGLTGKNFSELIHSRDIMWAPDGDEAFDDRSYVLQFDCGDRVRLIGFRPGDNNLHDPSTLSEVWLPADDFYGILQQWRESFVAEWAKSPKVPDNSA